MSETKHTVTPWRIGGGSAEFVVSTIGNEPSVARATGPTHEHARANAAHIVKCVNAHESLVEALEEILRSGVEHETQTYVVMQVDKDAVAQARAALALAEGKESK